MAHVRFMTDRLLPAKLPYFICAAVLISACFANNAMSEKRPAQPSQLDEASPFGQRNPNGPVELAQFEFVIGDWDVDLTHFPRTEDPVSRKARWHNIWIADGHVVMQEWRGPFVSGAELRAWEVEKKQWLGMNIYAGGNWRTTHAQLVDGKMIVYNENAVDAGGPFINRETYYDIEPNSFKIKSEKSYDAGKTWVRGNYEMTANRIRN